MGPNHATLGRHELAARALASFSFEFRAKALMPFILAQSVSSSAAVLSQSADEVIEQPRCLLRLLTAACGTSATFRGKNGHAADITAMIGFDPSATLARNFGCDAQRRSCANVRPEEAMQ